MFRCGDGVSDVGSLQRAPTRGIRMRPCAQRQVEREQLTRFAQQQRRLPRHHHLTAHILVALHQLFDSCEWQCGFGCLTGGA